MTAGISWLRLSEYSAEELLARAGLTPDEKARLAAFPESAAQRRKERLAARVLVRQVGGNFVGGTMGGGDRDRWRIRYEPSGRPYLGSDREPERRWPISISHTTGWVAVMVAPPGATCCGIDIEHLDRDASRVIRRIASPTELALAETLYPRNPALLIWCAKEAAYKALGVSDLDFHKHIRLTASDLSAAPSNTLSATVIVTPIALRFSETSTGLLVVSGFC